MLGLFLTQEGEYEIFQEYMKKVVAKLEAATTGPYFNCSSPKKESSALKVLKTRLTSERVALIGLALIGLDQETDCFVTVEDILEYFRKDYAGYMSDLAGTDDEICIGIKAVVAAVEEICRPADEFGGIRGAQALRYVAYSLHQWYSLAPSTESEKLKNNRVFFPPSPVQDDTPEQLEAETTPNRLPGQAVGTIDPSESNELEGRKEAAETLLPSASSAPFEDVLDNACRSSIEAAGTLASFEDVVDNTCCSIS